MKSLPFKKLHMANFHTATRLHGPDVGTGTIVRAIHLTELRALIVAVEHRVTGRIAYSFLIGAFASIR